MATISQVSLSNTTVNVDTEFSVYCTTNYITGIKNIVATLGDTSTKLVYSSVTKNFVGTLIAPSFSSYTAGTYTIYLVLTNTDNTTSTASIDLTVKEITPPTINFPSKSIVNGKQFIFTETDNDSGVNTNTLSITVDGVVVPNTRISISGDTVTYTHNYIFQGDYHDIIVTVADNDGNVTTKEETLYQFLYDRTEDDVERAVYLNEVVLNGTATEEELNEWNYNIIKGALNLDDLERIRSNVYLTSNLLGITVDTISFSDVPTSWSELYSALSSIHDNGSKYTLLPNVPDRPFNTYQKLNTIEYMLSVVYNLLSAQNYHYCGEVYGGEEIALI